MNELRSMLVPLDTLAGWPEAREPTALESLALLVGAPLLVFVVIYAVAKIDAHLQAKRGDAPPSAAESVWVGGRQAGGEIEATPEQHGLGADQDQQASGGAGARW